MLALLQSNASLNCVSERNSIASKGGYERAGVVSAVEKGSGEAGEGERTAESHGAVQMRDERGQGNVPIPT